MIRSKNRFLILCGMTVLASLAPLAVQATCPSIVVECSSGKTYSCSGTQNGDNCSYNHDCITGGKCGGFETIEEVNNY
jgi:hypothetical protein